MKTKLTELLGIRYPVIQGGMAWVAEHRLASAVSEAGGLGIIGAGGAPAAFVREEIRKASIVVTINLLLAVGAAIALCALQNLPTEDILLEVFSAIGTVGMSSGITRDLTSVSRVIIILLMYCGRIGSMTFALSFTERKKVAPVQLPAEKIIIG